MDKNDFSTGEETGSTLTFGLTNAPSVMHNTYVQNQTRLAAEGEANILAGKMPTPEQLKAMGMSESEALGAIVMLNLEQLDDVTRSNDGFVTTETRTVGETAETTVRDIKYLRADGNIDWDTWAPNGGRVPGTIQEGQTLNVGTIIDRYGNPYGKYASPFGVSYEQRALPYAENSSIYHKYEVLKPINDVVISRIAEAFEQPGGGMQYELPATIHRLIKEGYLKEIVE